MPVRSVAKSLGPDLRVAVLTGDRTTLDRVEGRLRLGACWVSHILQSIVVDCWSDPRTDALVDKARTTYAQRRTGLIDALTAHGIDATGPTGLNVWVPVPDEDSVISGLLARGWAVAGGERFRIRSGPAIRVTTATLDVDEAGALADDLAAVLHPATLPTTMA
jgi:DNA-binding transcriptional MocR family regulator